MSLIHIRFDFTDPSGRAPCRYHHLFSKADLARTLLEAVRVMGAQLLHPEAVDADARGAPGPPDAAPSPPAEGSLPTAAPEGPSAPIIFDVLQFVMEKDNHVVVLLRVR